MDIGHIASALHLLLGSFVLWIVPLRFAFLTDLVVFPVAFVLLLRDLIATWTRAAADSRKPLREDAHTLATSTARPESYQGTVRQRVQRANALSGSPGGGPGAADAQAWAQQGIVNRDVCTARLLPAKMLFLAAQVALFAMVLDFGFRPLLVPAEDLVVFRPGYVSHDTAKMHIRYPDGGQLELRYRVLAPTQGGDGTGWEPAGNTPWESAGEFAPPTSETDFTMTTALVNLQPSTKYLVELHSRQATLHAATVRLGSAEFKTAPLPGTPTKLRFGSGSCIKPNFPYRPSWTLDVAGFSSMFDHSDKLDMIMFMGDFIYADVPVYFGTDADDYRRLYRQVYAAPSARRLLRKVPMLHVYDDHEILNNWHDQDRPPMGSALTAYNEYNGRPNPPTAAPGGAYYNFTHGDIAFYAWDTRRYRTLWETGGGGGNDSARTMLGVAQKRHFAQWLRDVNHTAAVKFVISSVPVTTGWTNYDSSQDTWRGYPTERAEILNMTQYVPNLFFLSGDRHEMAAVELPSGNIEFSTSPVSQFTFPLVSRFKRDQDGEHTLHFRQRGHVKYGILDVDTETDPAVPRITYSLYTTDAHSGKRPVWVYEAKGAAWR